MSLTAGLEYETERWNGMVNAANLYSWLLNQLPNVSLGLQGFTTRSGVTPMHASISNMVL